MIKIQRFHVFDELHILGICQITRLKLFGTEKLLKDLTAGVEHPKLSLSVEQLCCRGAAKKNWKRFHRKCV